MAHQRQPDTAVTRRGLMLVLSSPSGAGKTTLSRKLLEEDEGVTLSVSVTTRKMRPAKKTAATIFSLTASVSMSLWITTNFWNGQKYLTITTERRPSL